MKQTSRGGARSFGAPAGRGKFSGKPGGHGAAGGGKGRPFKKRERGEETRGESTGKRFYDKPAARSENRDPTKGRPFRNRGERSEPRSERPQEGVYRAEEKPWGKPVDSNNRFEPRREERDERAKPFVKRARDDGARSERPKARFQRDEARPWGKPAGKKFEAKRSEGRGAPKRFAPRREEHEDAVPAVKATRQGIVLWGVHAAREAWLNPKRACHNLFVTIAGMAAMEEAIAKAGELGLNRPAPQIMERTDLERLLPPSSVHQGVALDVEPLVEMSLRDLLAVETLPDILVVLDQVTDPHNVGAILRSAAAFGAGAVIMTERNAPNTTGVMAKTASGAAEHVPQIHVVNLARALIELKEAGYWCVGLAEQGEKELGALDLSARTAIVLGAEGDGLRRLTREHCDELARLPTGGAIGSLNVSNAAAVGLYEARRQKGKFKTPASV